MAKQHGYQNDETPEDESLPESNDESKGAEDEEDDEEEMQIRLDFKIVKVSVASKSGVARNLEIREMTGAARDCYLNGIGKRSTQDGKGVRDFNGIQSSLLKLCLFEDGKLLTEKAIQEFPASAQSLLYKRAIKINALGADAKDKAKND